MSNYSRNPKLANGCPVRGIRSSAVAPRLNRFFTRASARRAVDCNYGRAMDFITGFIMDRLLGATRGEARVEGGRRVVTANLGVKLLAGLFPAGPLGGLYAAGRYGADGNPVSFTE